MGGADGRLHSHVYSLIDLRDVLLGCNRRYLEFLSALDDFFAGKRNLDKLTTPKNVDGHRVLVVRLQAPRFHIAGVRRADLKPLLPQRSPAPGTGRMKKSAHDL